MIIFNNGSSHLGWWHWYCTMYIHLYRSWTWNICQSQRKENGNTAAQIDYFSILIAPGVQITSKQHFWNIFVKNKPKFIIRPLWRIFHAIWWHDWCSSCVFLYIAGIPPYFKDYFLFSLAATSVSTMTKLNINLNWIFDTLSNNHIKLIIHMNDIDVKSKTLQNPQKQIYNCLICNSFVKSSINFIMDQKKENENKRNNEMHSILIFSCLPWLSFLRTGHVVFAKVIALHQSSGRSNYFLLICRLCYFVQFIWSRFRVEVVVEHIRFGK